MKKLLCFIVVAILLFSSMNGMNKKDFRKKEVKNDSFTLHGSINEKMIFNDNTFNNFNIFSFILSILFPNLFEKINLWKSSTANLNDDIDQSQEKSDGYYKVYGDHWYAQSFIPGSDKSKLTKVEILINKHIRTLRSKAFERLKNRVLGNKLGPITLEIRETLDGVPIVYKTLQPDDIPKNGDGEWITFDIADVFGIPDTDLWIDHTYYIVVHASGGDENNYYRWYFASGDPYGRGMAYSSYDNATTWNKEQNNDFCFRTYGELSDELPDGKVERWALLVGVAKYEYGAKAPHCDNDAYDFRDVLVHHGWQSDHIIVLTNEQATEKTSQMLSDGLIPWRMRMIL